MVGFTTGEHPSVPVHGLALVLMGLSLGYLWFVGVTPLNAVKAGIPFLLAATILNTGRYASAYDFDVRQSLRVVTWGVGTLLGAGWMAFVMLFVLLAEGVVVEDSLFIFLTSMAGGAAAGSALGATKVRVTQEHEKLARERERIERMNQRLRVINRVLRHNFQNKLNVLKLWAGRVTDEVDNTVVTQHSDTVTEAVNRLEELTEKTRNFEAVNDHEGRVPLDFETLVDQQVQAVRSATPELTVRTDLEPGVTVRAHRMLEMAVGELLENAVEHNDAASVTITVDLEREPAAGDAVLTVTDDGVGIPDDERAAVEAGDETPLLHGSGMGLWLVRAIVVESDGEFSIEAGDEGGARVVLRLPTAEAAQAPVAEPAPRGSTATDGDRVVASVTSDLD